MATLSSRPDLRAVVELGAGDGALLTAIHQANPELSLYGVELRERPVGLDAAISWCRDLWDVRTDTWTSGEAAQALSSSDGPTALLAVEWLDDLPCVVAERREDLDLLEVHVDCHGAERLGRPLGLEESQWTTRWWPYGSRVEVGLGRDRAWADAVRRLRRCGGLALMIDYGHRRPARPVDGSLSGYARGRQLVPVPDKSMNLTAHVAVDAVRDAGEQAGGRTVVLAQLVELVATTAPATTPDPLAALVQRSQRAALSSPRVWGQQYWLQQEVPRSDGERA